MIGYFRSVGQVAWGLIKGLRVTWSYLFSPAVTVSYPMEKLTLSERYRGALAFHPDICISCDMCVRACPSKCIDLESSRNETTKKKDLSWYTIDFAKCNYCRLCEEICPTKPKSVHHTREYELTFSKREDFVMRWTVDNPQPPASDPGQVWGKFVAQGQRPFSAPGKNASELSGWPVA